MTLANTHEFKNIADAVKALADANAKVEAAAKEVAESALQS